MLDATVVVPWFDVRPTATSDAARRLRAEYEAGELEVAVPTLLFLEVLNVAGRQWGWDEPTLADLANELQALEFEVIDPPLPLVASWVARGLTSYDATYVALAQNRGIALVTSDREILRVGRGVARSPDSSDGD